MFARSDPSTDVAVACMWVEATSFQGLLPEYELRRAARYLRQEDRLRFLCARLLLRAMLSASLDVDPSDVALEGAGCETEYRGKPRVVSIPALDFSVTHAGSLVMVGLARDSRIGVDAEPSQSSAVLEGMSPMVLSESETYGPRGTYQSLLQAWVIKEALLKATGEGLAHGMEQVTLCPHGSLFKVAAGTVGIDSDLAIWSSTGEPGYEMAICLSASRSPQALPPLTWTSVAEVTETYPRMGA